jgi:putative transposase
MARRQRLYVPGYPAHIVVRGNNRQVVFRSEGDRVYFHRCLVETTRRFGMAVHAYVFMDNHVHILGTGEATDTLSKVVQSVGRRYVSYFNYLHGRTGTLWEGRFHSSLVESERYFRVCHQYVEANPVRAGMAEDPGLFRWSSHGANAFDRADDLVTPHSLYMELGGSELDRRRAYRRLFDLPIDEATLAAIRHAERKGWALGGTEFCERLEALSGRRAMPRKRGRPPRTIGKVAGREKYPISVIGL